MSNEEKGKWSHEKSTTKSERRILSHENLFRPVV